MSALHQRQLFLRKRLAVVEAEEQGATVLVRTLARYWWGRWALRLALNRIDGGA
jgi:hypothetical protein